MKKGIRILAAVLVVMTLAVSVYAEKFTPSVEQKGAPAIAVFKDGNQNDVVAMIHDGAKKDVAGVPTGKLTVTPYADAKKAGPEVEKMLVAAYKQVAEAENLSGLSKELPAVLAQVKEKLGLKDLKVENLVVRDLFDISLDSELKEEYLKEGNTISVTFQLNMKPSEALLVLHNYEADKWETIADDRVERHENGDVTVTFDSLSPVAFVVDGTPYGVQPEAPASNNNTTIMIVAAVIIVVGIVGVVVVLNTKKNKKAKVG